MSAYILGGLLFVKDFPLAVTRPRVSVTSEKRLALRKIGFFGLAAAPAI
jgi:hypothetical protein